MKETIKIVTILLSLIIASHAHAMDITTNAQIQSDEFNELTAPDPVAGDVYRYSELKEIYNLGLRIKFSQLKGSWNLIALATTQECALLSKDRFDDTGIKNSDNSTISINFDYSTKKALPGSGVEKEKYQFSVWLNNFGTEASDQGPFSVSESEPQFSQWAYRGSDITTEAYFSYSCRQSRYDDNVMACGVTPSVKINDTCLGEQMGAIYVFMKN
ncbi:MAG: hypothetical protein KDD40_00360 [Bdellovibrionales bacterium]|nr:hypothetical protein [Bdellovibrionales bacterium]